MKESPTRAGSVVRKARSYAETRLHRVVIKGIDGGHQIARLRACAIKHATVTCFWTLWNNKLDN